MRLKTALTDRGLQGLKPNKEKQIDVWEPNGRVNGFSFGVRVSPAGSKTFQIMYRDSAKRLHRMTIGSYPEMCLADARAKAQKYGGGSQLGEDPAAQRLVDIDRGPTFGQLWDRYVAAAEMDGRNLRYDSILATKHLVPALKDLPLSEIKRDRVWDLQDAILKRAREDNFKGVSVNRAMQLLCRVFNFGVNAGVCEGNPVVGLRKRVKEEPRDHTYSVDEIRALWGAFEKEAILWSISLKLQLLTGARGGEIHAMEWREIRNDVWTIPPAKTKKRREHKVPLSRQAVALLEAMRPFTGNGLYVFPSERTGQHVKVAKHLRERLRRNAGLEDLPDGFNLHDLRHVVVTNMLSKPLSIQPHVVSAVVGHVDRSMARATRIYDSNEYLEEKADALQRWADRLDVILKEKETQRQPGAIVGRA